SRQSACSGRCCGSNRKPRCEHESGDWADGRGGWRLENAVRLGNSGQGQKKASLSGHRLQVVPKLVWRNIEIGARTQRLKPKSANLDVCTSEVDALTQS